MTDVLIARHGQSEWNAVGRWQGQADAPLSELGRLQAAHAASRLSAIDVIIASDLDRARTTAQIIAEALDHPAEVAVDPDFRERHAGEWQGLTKDEIEKGWPGYLAERRRPPGFEPDGALTERTAAALRRALDRHAGARILVVSHGGVIYRLEETLGQEVVRIPNLGGRWFYDRDRGLELGERILLVEPDEVTIPSQL
jgi:probable phosphoglycerate mutase